MSLKKINAVASGDTNLGVRPLTTDPQIAWDFANYGVANDSMVGSPSRRIMRIEFTTQTIYPRTAAGSASYEGEASIFWAVSASRGSTIKISDEGYTPPGSSHDDAYWSQIQPNSWR